MSTSAERTAVYGSPPTAEQPGLLSPKRRIRRTLGFPRLPLARSRLTQRHVAQLFARLSMWEPAKTISVLKISMAKAFSNAMLPPALHRPPLAPRTTHSILRAVRQWIAYAADQ